MKKFVSLALALMMVLAFVPAVFAADYTDVTLYAVAEKPAIDGVINAGEYAASFDATHTSGEKAPEVKYYMAWTDTDLHYAVEATFDAADLTDAQKASAEALINSINIYTYIYRGDYRTKTADDPDFIQYITYYKADESLYKFRYLAKNEDGKWKSHQDGSTRMWCEVTEDKAASTFTVTIEQRIQMDSTVIAETSTTANGAYTIGSYVDLMDGEKSVGRSYFAPGTKADTYEMGYYVATRSDEVNTIDVAYDNTDAAEDTTAAVEDTTAAVEDTTAAVEDTTAAVEDTTAAVEDTTAAVEDTTAAVEDTTAAVEDTTAAVEDTTAAEDTTVAEDTTAATDDTDAPATFDAFVVAAVIAAASAAGIVVSKKRR